jgi:hypothetical protein
MAFAAFVHLAFLFGFGVGAIAADPVAEKAERIWRS